MQIDRIDHSSNALFTMRHASHIFICKMQNNRAAPKILTIKPKQGLVALFLCKAFSKHVVWGAFTCILLISEV